METVEMDPRQFGFLRVEESGGIHFMSPAPRVKLWSKRKVEEYLLEQQDKGNLLGLHKDMFVFSRRKKAVTVQKRSVVVAMETSEEPAVEVTKVEEGSTVNNLEFMVKQMTVDPERRRDHGNELQRAAAVLESLAGRHRGDGGTLELLQLKEKLSAANSCEELLAVLHKDDMANKGIVSMVRDICFAELAQLDTSSGVLVDFPPNVNLNFFAAVIDYAMANAWRTLEFLRGFVVREGEGTRGKHVIRLAVMFSSLAFSVNQNLNAMAKLRSLALQVDGLTGRGLDLLANQRLATATTTMDSLRDTFSAVGPLLSNSLAATKSAMTCLDNCDVAEEHLTLEYKMFEPRTDTSHLSTTKLTLEQAIDLFKPETVLLTIDENKEEKEHLMYVFAVGVGRVLAKVAPEEAKVLGKLLPTHHSHANSARVLVPAEVVIEPPYPFQETKNADTIQLCLKRQRKFLKRVAVFMGHEPEFMKNLKLLEDSEADREVREAAEEEVKKVIQVYGEDISHGDLLTVKMMMRAKDIMSGSTTAFGRLEFLGDMRLGLFHLKMKKVTVDFKAMMRHVTNYDDRGSLAFLAASTNCTKVTSDEKEIKKSFELHDQFFEAVAEQGLANIFSNWIAANPDELLAVVDEESAVNFVLAMLSHYGVIGGLFFDPRGQVEQVQVAGEDDLMLYYRELVTRFLPSLALDLCEQEGDAEGLVALLRLFYGYFLGSNLRSQNVKYLDFVLFDLVTLFSSSERSRRRMELNTVINPTGARRGGMFFDKYCELVVRQVKGCLHRQQGGLDDILLETKCPKSAKARE